MKFCIFLETIQEKILSGPRMLFVALLLVLKAVEALSMSPNPFGSGLVFAYVLVLGAGIIGADVSGGVLQLIFARPIRRSAYVLSRWAGLVAAALMLYLLQVILCLAVMLARGQAVELGSLPGEALSAVYMTLVLSSFMVFLSSSLPGYGDIRMYIFLLLLSIVLKILSEVEVWAEVASVSKDFLEGFLAPSLEIDLVLRGVPLGWLTLLPYLAAVAVPLIFAVCIMNRKEVCYGAA